MGCNMRLSITHSQAGLCCIGPPSARPGTFYEMLHTATLAPSAIQRLTPGGQAVSFLARSAIDRDEGGDDGLCGMEDELVHGYRSL